MRYLTASILRVILTLVCLQVSWAQPRDIWVRRYTEAPPGRAGYEFYDIYLTVDASYALCGSMSFGVNSSGLWVLITDDEGGVLLNRSYRQEMDDHYIRGRSIIQADDEGFVVGGVSEWEGRARFSLTKLNPEGDVEWWNHYGASSGSCRGVIELKDGGYAACGYDREGNAGLRGYVIGVNGAGELLWERRFRETTTFNALKETEGGIVLVGFENYILKIEFNGDRIWDRRLNGPDVLYDLTSCDGGFAMCGVHVEGEWNNNHRLIRITGQGEVLWDHNYDFGRREHAFDITLTQDGGFFITGESYNQEGSQSFASLIRTDLDGNLMWHRTDSLLGEIWPQNYKSSILDPDGSYVVAGSCRPARGGTLGGLIVKIVPERSAPTIVEWSPELLRLEVLQGDSVEFWVRAVDLQDDSLRYSWMLDDEEAATDSLTIIEFPDLGEHLVHGIVSDSEQADSLTWHITVSDLFIVSHTPDSLGLTLRRGASVDFSIDSVVAVEGEEIEYLWTLANLDNPQPEVVSNDSLATIEFLRSGNYALEAIAGRGESFDVVTWTMSVRSAVWSFWPDELSLTVPPDTVINFGVNPFNPESDSLSYAWYFGEDLLGMDSAVDVQFGGEGRVEVTAIVTDGAEVDTLLWNVLVQPLDAVGSDFLFPLSSFGLSASPNPFNSEMLIRFDTPIAEPVRLALYDLGGREVARLAGGLLPAGEHSALLDGRSLTAGVYLLRLQTTSASSVRKVVLLK